MRNFLIASIFACFLSAPAFAAGACYSPIELQAEHLLRLHSELMVITVTCRTGSQGEDLVRAYTGFTNYNIGELHDAEQTMVRYYEAHGANDGVEKLDQLRTKLGNEYGQKIADMSAPVFCQKLRDKPLAYRELDKGDVRDEVERMTISEHSYVRPCNGAPTQLAKKGQ
jgi:hypothetical protein